MDMKKIPIGLVEGIVGINWLRVTVEGEANHAGTTPMKFRRDAVVASARMVTAIQEIACKTEGNLVATVGSMDVRPNSINVIPGRTTFTVDLRAFDDDTRAKTAERIEHETKRIASLLGCSVSVEGIWSVNHIDFSKKGLEVVKESIEMFGFPYMRIVSGAAHDAQYLSQICDAAMIFVPSKGGKSHCEEESTDWCDLEKGASVVLLSVLKAANM